MALLAPLAIEWLCMGIDRVHCRWTHAELPEGRLETDLKAKIDEGLPRLDLKR